MSPPTPATDSNENKVTNDGPGSVLYAGPGSDAATTPSSVREGPAT